ncbi:hypothetical protein [Armatimonas sp.]|uniref:hypothetical protein n=1 Tax=Armatimonas sp. TaxID=1872638 RepID=UPI003752AA2B
MMVPVARTSPATILPAPLTECEAIARMKTILITLDQIAKRIDAIEESGSPQVEVGTHGNTL